MKYKYIGEAEKVFPHLGITVKPGDEFDAPAAFVATNVVPVETKQISSFKHKAKDDEVKTEQITEPSAASDTTLGE